MPFYAALSSFNPDLAVFLGASFVSLTQTHRAQVGSSIKEIAQSPVKLFLLSDAFVEMRIRGDVLAVDCAFPGPAMVEAAGVDLTESLGDTQSK